MAAQLSLVWESRSKVDWGTVLGCPGTGKQIAESAFAESARQRVVKMAVVNCIVERLVMRLGCTGSRKRSGQVGNK